VYGSDVGGSFIMEHGCLVDKKGKKWVISGYYFDGNMGWTILIAADGSGKSKRVKGVI